MCEVGIGDVLFDVSVLYAYPNLSMLCVRVMIRWWMAVTHWWREGEKGG
jgi:hypothetical protein